MSTRSQIGFYERETHITKPSILIYRHSDGYPDTEHGVIATVVPILKDFQENRGLSDIEYGAAWLVAKLKEDYLNIGICSRDHEMHSDIEFYYAVYPDRMDVYEAPRGWDKCLHQLASREPIKTIKL